MQYSLYVAGLAATAMLAGVQIATAQDSTDWSGFYAGIYGGYGLDNEPAENDSATLGPFDDGAGNITTVLQTNASTRIEGLVGGIGAGYNHQINQFVLGLDGAVHLGETGKSVSDTVSFNVTDGVDTLSVDLATNTSVDLDWYSSLTGTFGVAFDHGWLVYAKAGAAMANVSSRSSGMLDVQTTNPGYMPVAFPIGTTTGTAAYRQIVFGPTFGIGLEKMVTENISLGAEYTYLALPQVTVPVASTGIAGGGYLQVPLSFHSAKASLKFHF